MITSKRKCIRSGEEDGKQSESLCDDDSNSSDSELSGGPLFPDPGVVDDGDDDVDAGSAAEERGKTAHKGESMNGSVFLMPTAEAFRIDGSENVDGVPVWRRAAAHFACHGCGDLPLSSPSSTRSLLVSLGLSIIALSLEEDHRIVSIDELRKLGKEQLGNLQVAVLSRHSKQRIAKLINLVQVEAETVIVTDILRTKLG